MVGAGTDPQPAVMLQEHELDLAAGTFTHRLDGVLGSEPRGRDAIEDGRRRRPLHPERFQFLDVLLDRGRIASGPAGDHGLSDRDLAAGSFRSALQGEREDARHGLSKYDCIPSQMNLVWSVAGERGGSKLL